jgi:hypothetical protein
MWISAGEFHDVDAESAVPHNNGGLAAWRFPAAGGAQHMVFATVWRPSKWVNGVISFDFYYSESTADTANMVIHWEVSTWSTGDTLAGTFDMLDQSATVATQASANKLWKKHWGYDTTPAPSSVTTSDEFIGVGTGRNANAGDDTFDDDLDFYGVLLTYIPNNRQ